MRRLTTALVAFILAATACGGTNTDDPGLSVVATTTILGDLARNVVGANGTVEVLLPLGADPHDYQASARQAASLQDADLVVVNGLGLEEGLTDVLEASADDGARVIEIAPNLNPISWSDPDGGTRPDPHVWLDPLRMADAAMLLADELVTIAPDVDWQQQAASYASELVDTDAEIRRMLSAVTSEHRRLVTSHDSLRYFAERYDFAVVGVVIPGGSTLANPSSADLAVLVDQIRRLDIPAIFTESAELESLAATLAAEVDGVAVVELYVGSLGGPGSDTETLIDLLLANAELIAAALA